MGVFRQLNKFISKSGYKISKSVKTDSILTNVFNVPYTKHALVSYLQQPFQEGIKFHHSNYLECYTAAEILNELGYAVDVVSWNDTNVVVDYTKYDAVYGFGFSFERAYYSDQAERIIKLFYSSGCNPFYSNVVSTLRIFDFYESKKLLIPQSSRILETFYSLEYLLSDLIIALGNQFVANTYLTIHPRAKCKPINAFYFDVYDIDLKAKEFDKAKLHFLWFGSSGLLHKGLDLVIDYFAMHKNVYLHICGASKSEEKFFSYYQPKIDNCSNIIDHGFVDIKSDDFKKIMATCCFTIFPSVSEGGAPSLLNVMANGGLIPVAPMSTGVDIDRYGIVIQEINEKGINESIARANELSIDEVVQKSNFVKESIRKEFTYSNYKNRLSQLIGSALQNKQ